MPEPVTHVAVVGCGYWGKNLVRSFHELGSLRAIYDADPSRMAELSGRHGVPSASSFSELLCDEKIRGVVIAAPAVQHFRLAKEALLAGKDVFVEKPLALHVEQGEELVRLAAKQDCILMVGHLLQYHPAVLRLKELCRDGELGKIQYIYSTRLNWGKLRTEENILWSFAPHDISTILYLLEEDPTAVSAHGGCYLDNRIADVTLTSCDFASGTKAHIFVSWLHPFKEQKLVVVGGRKVAVFDDGQAENKLVVYPHQIDWVNRIPVAHKKDGQVIPISGDEPLKLECRHFLECITVRKRPRTDGENGVRVLKILHACGQSLEKQGQPIFTKVSKPKYVVHESAIVDDPCEIGEGTRIWHFSHVMAESSIGKNCNLGQNVHVASGVRIGNNVKIQNNVSLYSGVELEDDVFCGPSMVFTNVTNPRSHVNRRKEYQRTLVKCGATLGANSTIVCGTTIGRYAFVGAGAVVTHDVPDYALVIGVPAHQVGWVCQCGVRLSLLDDEAICSRCNSSYSLHEGRLLAQDNDQPDAGVAQKYKTAAV